MRKRVLKVSIIVLLWCGGLILGNIILAGKKKDYDRANPNILTELKVTFCDGHFVRGRYVVDGRNVTCLITYRRPRFCTFPSNSLLVYTSEDNKHCSLKTGEKYEGIILFNMIYCFAFGLCIIFVIMYCILDLKNEF